MRHDHKKIPSKCSAHLLYSDHEYFLRLYVIKYVRLIVYQMGRLCGGAHEISGIKAPIFLRGWVGGGGTDGGGVGVGVVEWVVVGW